MIYFAQPTNGGPIRIGSSSNTDARKRTMGTWVPGGVETVLEIKGGCLGEFVLHQCFNPLRIERDWFKSCDVIWKFIIDAKARRPKWVSEHDGVVEKIPREDLIKEFGDSDVAAKLLGYNSIIAFEQAARFQSTLGYALSARIAFFRLLRDGKLPSYIAEMHDFARTTATEVAA